MATDRDPTSLVIGNRLPRFVRRWLLTRPFRSTAAALVAAATIYSTFVGAVLDSFSLATLAIIGLSVFVITAGLAARVNYEEREAVLAREDGPTKHSVQLELSKYRRILSELTHRYSVKSEDTKVIRYTIGRTADQDHAWTDIQTRVREQPLLWKTLSIGLTGTSALPSFEEIQFKREPKTSDFLALDNEDSNLRGMIVFVPQIAIGTTFSWSFGYEWPVWNDLRTTGRDRCVVDVESDVLKVSVSFIFPDGAADINLIAPVDNDTGKSRGTLSEPDARTRTWEIKNPLPGRYEFRVSMRSLR